ncbi:MAG: hypothetical protein P4L43_05300 [Syntrophobacteraceae bacterium]|nr:hypothetical protein [Syntrophobacteraceae bacterium]
MSKKIILGLAIALTLVSGVFMNAQAQNATGPYFAKPACWSFACGLPGIHENVSATQAPVQMGSVGY